MKSNEQMEMILISERWGSGEILLVLLDTQIAKLPDDILYAMLELLYLRFGVADLMAEVSEFLGFEGAVGSESFLLQKGLEDLFCLLGVGDGKVLVILVCGIFPFLWFLVRCVFAGNGFVIG
jgi:hypothetical protein